MQNFALSSWCPSVSSASLQCEWTTWSTKGIRECLTMAPRAGMGGCRTHTAYFLILRYPKGLGKSWGFGYWFGEANVPPQWESSQ